MLRYSITAILVCLAACASPAGVSPAPPDATTAPAAPAAPTTTRTAWFKHAPWDTNLPEVKKTGTGLEYVVIASGPATGVSPRADQSARMYYEGRLNSGGRAFDSAFERGKPDTYALSDLVKGMREALMLMKPGDRWIIYIPAALGYADRGYPGLIGPGENLLFEILLEGVE